MNAIAQSNQRQPRSETPRSERIESPLGKKKARHESIAHFATLSANVLHKRRDALQVKSPNLR